MMLRAGKKNKGFLLLEVMVSVAILSGSLIMILGSFIGSVRAKELSEDIFRAGLLMERKISEVFNSEIEEGSSEGMFDDFDNRFSWSLDVAGMEEEGLNEVALEILWKQGNKEQGLSVVTYLLPLP